MTQTRIVFILSLALVVLLGGCFNSKRDPVYVASDEIDPIEVPPELDKPLTRDIFEIPGYSLPELAAQGDQESPPQVQPSSVAEKSRSQIRFGPTGLYLAVEDVPESVWRRLGFSLNRGGMQVKQVDEGQRTYLFSFTHEPIRADSGFLDWFAFWSGPDVVDYSGDYIARVATQTRDGVTRVELLHTDGSVIDMDRAEFVLARLRDRLG